MKKVLVCPQNAKKITEILIKYQKKCRARTIKDYKRLMKTVRCYIGKQLKNTEYVGMRLYINGGSIVREQSKWQKRNGVYNYFETTQVVIVFDERGRMFLVDDEKYIYRDSFLAESWAKTTPKEGLYLNGKYYNYQNDKTPTFSVFDNYNVSAFNCNDGSDEKIVKQKYFKRTYGL